MLPYKHVCDYKGSAQKGGIQLRLFQNSSLILRPALKCHITWTAVHVTYIACSPVPGG